MMNTGKINFGAGPAALPPEVLYEFSKAVVRYRKTGYSILELPHRSPEFKEILTEANELVKDLCNLNDDYEVLWMHGGGRAQFVMIPMNFLGKGMTGGYVDSGHWAHEAQESAQQTGNNGITLASAKSEMYNHVPKMPTTLPSNLEYVHITTNNTIYGTQYHSIPRVNAPLIADMSSDIFSGKRDYSRFAMFYAVAQKNFGTPGVTLAVLHKKMLKKCNVETPAVFSYAMQVKEKNLLNTPNISGIYLSLLLLRWIKNRGIAAIETENIEKARILYEAIDNSELLMAHVPKKEDRSLMNVVFTAKDTGAEKRLLQLCHENDIIGIEGHRSIGGFRASLYNAVTLDSVKTLVDVIGRI